MRRDIIGGVQTERREDVDQAAAMLAAPFCFMCQ
jgi:hypothetical protein